MMQFLEFPDKCVSYSTFLNDVAAKIVRLLKDDRNDPEYISQRKAFEMFGRRNVERWRRLKRITPIRRPGKLEYLMADLRLQQRTQQDYLEP